MIEYTGQLLEKNGIYKLPNLCLFPLTFWLNLLTWFLGPNISFTSTTQVLWSATLVNRLAPEIIANLFWSGVNIQDRCNSNIPFKVTLCMTWRHPTYLVKHPPWERKTNQPDSGRASGTSPRTWSAPPSARRSPSLAPGSCRPSTARSALIVNN